MAVVEASDKETTVVEPAELHPAGIHDDREPGADAVELAKVERVYR